ncbi:MAG: hypothetical protein EBR82_76845, partial [Caulobacteraceae bacterium]|nr:hypothetical protein [Caulobacteraceae bacterium]
MRIYEIQAPNGRIYEIQGPDDISQEQLFNFVQSQIYNEDLERLKKEREKLRQDSFKPVDVKPIEKQSVFRQVADVPIGIARGAAQGIRMIADAFGPDNVVSQA